MIQIDIDTWLINQTSRGIQSFLENAFFLILDNSGELASDQICRTTYFSILSRKNTFDPSKCIFFFLERKTEVWKR